MEYVERARAAAAALGPVEATGEDEVGAAARLVGLAAAQPVAAPAAGSRARRSGRRAVGRLVGWYLDHLVPPAARLGEAAARNGAAVSERLRAIEARQVAGREALRSEVAALAGRVGELERRLSRKRPEDPTGPPARP